VVADEAQAYCPRLQRLVPWCSPIHSCLDIYEFLNISHQLRSGLNTRLNFFFLISPSELFSSSEYSFFALRVCHWKKSSHRTGSGSASQMTGVDIGRRRRTPIDPITVAC
jgi:hypothetical protein